MFLQTNACRHGTVLPILTVSITVLMGFVALAIDIGMLAQARVQAQNAADVAALVGVRTLSGNAGSNYNYSNSEPAARIAAKANNILGSPIQDSQITVDIGSYDYDQTQNKFIAKIPKAADDTYSLVQTTVTTNSNNKTAFARVFGMNAFSQVSVNAQAAHRPRDICLIVDFSGSMRFSSLGGIPYSGNRNNGLGNNSGSNNPESVYPLFGHYCATNAGLQGPTTATTISGNYYGASNLTEACSANQNRPPIVQDFYKHNAFATPELAWPASWKPSDDYATTPGGDKPLRTSNATSGTTNYATTVNDIVGSTAQKCIWELDGYSAASAGTGTLAWDLTSYLAGTSGLTTTDYTSTAFNGYTQGPRYWGKTFFMWPPDPRWPLTSSTADQTYINTILQDLGYSASQLSSNTKARGIYIATSNAGSNNWDSWTAANLSAYLTSATNNLKPPALTTPLTTADPVYRAIMRLFNRPQNDWRRKFFYNGGTTTPLTDNTRLWASSSPRNWKAPSSSNYTVNYTAILAWIKNTGTNPFPTQLRAGHIKFYDAIPDSITGSYPNYGNTNERFWREYIDYVLGLNQSSSSNYDVTTGSNNSLAESGYGDDFNWGTVAVSGVPASGQQYMSYTDNPRRPRSRLWFGPMTMVDFMGNYNRGSDATQSDVWMWPGDCHEAPLYACKLGLRGSLTDMRNNHPNDFCSLIYFSDPRTSSTDNSNRFNAVRSPLGKRYDYMIANLFFPPKTIDTDGTDNNTEVTPYDNDNVEAPRAYGSTCYSYPLMLAYNQFANTPTSDNTLRNYATPSANIPEGLAGGMGRKGAQKIIVFETDGQPNIDATSSPAAPTSATGFKYYNIRYNPNAMSSSEYPSVSSTTSTTHITTIINALTDEYGTSTSRKPLRLYPLAFGPAFDSSVDSSDATTGLGILRGMMDTAGTPVPSGTASGTLPSTQIITGTDDEMIDKLQAIITQIMQGSISVTLIK